MTAAVQAVPVAASSTNRWVQLLLGVIAMMAISSPQYVWTLFTGPLNQQLGTTLAELQWTVSLLVILQTWFSPFQAYLVDRFGPRLLISIGALLSGGSWILAAWASNLWALYLTYGVIGGFGTGIIYVGIIGLMVRWFPDRRIYRSLKAGSLQEEIEDSLRRLRVDVIDLYQIHWPNPEDEIEEGWETLARFQQEGKVRHIGVSNFNVEQMKRVQKIAPITSLQPPYSMLAREIEDAVLPYTQANGIGVIVYSPMKSGLLSGAMTRARIAAMPEDDWRRRTPHFQEPRLTRNLELAEVLRTIGRQRDRQHHKD